MRSFTDQQRNELRLLKDASIEILAFLSKHHPESRQAPGLVEKSVTEKIEYIESAHLGVDKQLEKAAPSDILRGWHEALSDILEMVRDLSKQDRAVLDKLLWSKFGFNTQSESRKQQKAVMAILKRGKVRHSHEYRLLERRIEELIAESCTSREIEQINEVLATVSEPFPDD